MVEHLSNMFEILGFNVSTGEEDTYILRLLVSISNCFCFFVFCFFERRFLYVILES